MKRNIRLIRQQRSYSCEEDDTLLRAALRAGERLPYECNSGGCGTCKFQLVSGEVNVRWPEAPGWTERDRKTGRYLACQCQPVSDCEIKVASIPGEPPPYPPQRHQIELTRVMALTADMAEFHFQGQAPVHFLPGQYAMLELPGIAGSRAYSMSNLPNEQGEWQFIIKRMPGGLASHYLFEQLAVGESVYLDGPFGLAHLNADSQRPIVLVAGGSGLSPILSIARAVVHDPDMAHRPLHLFYGVRGPADLCIEPYLDADPLLRIRLQVTPVVSELETARQTGWAGPVGFVHEHLLETMGASLVEHEIYFCGPPPMVDALSKCLLVASKVPFDQVHYDRFF